MEARAGADLDFIVIGAQKAGTTSLWRYLRDHPRISMPSSKELPVFTAPSIDPDVVRRGAGALFADAPPGALCGTVTPDYMIGQGEIPVEVVAKRIAATFPVVRLIALLRDPVERAVSAYAMTFRRLQEARPLDVALAEELEPAALDRARREPRPSNSYVAAGEYGRILGAYRRGVRGERLLIAYLQDLANEPGRVIDDVLVFLGLEAGFRPPGLDIRHFRGGMENLLSAEAEAELRAFLYDEMLPRMNGSTAQHRRAVDFFLETWNVRPTPPPPLSAPLRERLRDHFRADAERLAGLGVEAPWITCWDRGA